MSFASSHTQHAFFATTAKNLETLLLEELTVLGVQSAKSTHLGVFFEGSLENAYTACLWSRLAHHIFLQLKMFEAANRETLYQQVKALDWSAHLREDQTFRIDVSGRHSTLTHPHFIAQIAKDAIVDQFRDRTGDRPSIQAERPDVVLQLHVRDNAFTLYLDLAGESLHRRGLRTETGVAPLKETLASALLIRAGWPQKIKQNQSILFDPCCGAGTILLEGAMMAYDIAPGLFREYFGFLRWKNHKPEIWKKLIQNAKLRHQQGLQNIQTPIIGFDINERTLASAEQNFKKLGLRDRVQLQQRDLAELDDFRLKEAQGLVITNPPYGRRLLSGKMQDIETLYARLGEAVKSHLEGWKLAVLTEEIAPVKALRMRPGKKYHFLNGTLECTLITFEINPSHYWHDSPAHE